MWAVKSERARFGPIEVAVLVALKERPMSGVELIDVLNKAMKRVGAVKSSVYMAIRRLKREGYIALIGKGPAGREVYALTKKGEETLAEIAKAVPSIVEASLEYTTFLVARLLNRIAKSFKEIASDLTRQRLLTFALVPEDEKSLLEYRNFLKSELKRVEERLKRMKKVEVK